MCSHFIYSKFIPPSAAQSSVSACNQEEGAAGWLCLRAQHLLIKITLPSNGRPVCILVGMGVAPRLIVQKVTQVFVSSSATFNDWHPQAASGGASCPVDASVSVNQGLESV